MFMPPGNSAALAEQHRQDLITQAHTHRAARASRHSRFAILAALAAALMAFGATPAFAGPHPQPNTGGAHVPPKPVQIHTVVTGGMPGWQIALIAAGAALLAAVLAVLADRMWAARRHQMARAN